MDLLETIIELSEELDTMNFFVVKREENEWILKFGRIEIRNFSKDVAFMEMIKALNLAIAEKQLDDDNKNYWASVI